MPVLNPDEEEEEVPKDLQEEITLEGMRVVRTGRGCYLCYSSTQPGVTYAVDISDHEGLGSCTCTDFALRRWPRYKKLRKPYNHCRCKHICRVRNFVLDQIIKHYSD